MRKVEKIKAPSLYLSLLTTILSSYLRLLSLLSSMSTTTAATDCSTPPNMVIPTPDFHARFPDSNHRFSAGVNCSSAKENATCQIQYGGRIIEEGTIKMTTASKIKVYDAIG